MRKGRVENLVPITTETARELGRRGAEVSNRKQKERKMFKEALLDLLKENKPNEEVTYQQSILLALLRQADAGNVNAFVELRNTIGEKPVDKVEFQGDISSVSKDIGDYANSKTKGSN